MEVLRRLAHKLIRPSVRVRRARATSRDWLNSGLLPGINEVAAGTRAKAPAPEAWVAHALDLDIGEVADGHHLIARSISLSARHRIARLTFDLRTGEAKVGK